VQQTNMGIGFQDNLAVQFKNQSQHTVRCWMLRAEVLHEERW
jgi:hypothetical protein